MIPLTRESNAASNSTKHFSVVINETDSMNDGEVFYEGNNSNENCRHLEIIRQDVDEIMGNGLLASPVILYSVESVQEVSLSSPSLGCLDDLIMIDPNNA